MLLSDWLKKADRKLKSAGIATARLDALVLLEDELKKDKSYLLSHPEEELNLKSLSKLNKQVQKRAKHEPLSYIRGKSEFYGREFLVNKHTLEPRPETETMVEQLLDLANRQQITAKSLIIDVGTGSGCIAITAKLELPGTKIYATDISSKCLGIARINSMNLNAEISFHRGDLLGALPTNVLNSPLLILANLPYVPNKYSINKAAKNEPKIAIFGGEDGLDIYRRLFAQLKKLAKKPAFVLTESLPFQHKELAKIAELSGYALKKTDDFIQLFKVV